MHPVKMKRSRVDRSGFTLIELMIVVAIVSILASIAVPQYKKFQLKAKTSEAKINIHAIRVSEEWFATENDYYKVAGWAPGVVPGAARLPFDSQNADTEGFVMIGFRPAGDVYFSYLVAGSAPAGNILPDSKGNDVPNTEDVNITIIAVGDLDNNGGHGQSPDPNDANNSVFYCTDEVPRIRMPHEGSF